MKFHSLLYSIILAAMLLLSACAHKRKKFTYQPGINSDAGNDFVPPIGEKDVPLNNTINYQAVQKGQTIYLVKCRICHYISAATLTGPGWKNITQRRTPAWIMNMILSPDLMVQYDAEAKKQRQMFNITMPVLQLSREEARDVLEFMRHNDGIR